jgi:hypothetical protein
MRRAHLWFQTDLAAYIFAVERTMPVSVYFQSVVFLILAAVALFASAGTLAIPGFWPYLAIFAAIILASLVELDPGLLRERMRPGGKHRPLRCVCLPLCCSCTGSSRGSTAAAFIGATVFRPGSRLSP